MLNNSIFPESEWKSQESHVIASSKCVQQKDFN
jgi:hypothetical protein